MSDDTAGQSEVNSDDFHHLTKIVAQAVGTRTSAEFPWSIVEYQLCLDLIRFVIYAGQQSGADDLVFDYLESRGVLLKPELRHMIKMHGWGNDSRSNPASSTWPQRLLATGETVTVHLQGGSVAPQDVFMSFLQGTKHAGVSLSTRHSMPMLSPATPYLHMWTFLKQHAFFDYIVVGEDATISTPFKLILCVVMLKFARSKMFVT